MAFLTKAFFRGLAALVPIVVTVYILWWFVSGGACLAFARRRGTCPELLLHKLGIDDGLTVTPVHGARVAS